MTPNRRPTGGEGARGQPGGSAPGDPIAGVAQLPWELPHRFLGLDDAGADFGRARAVILPVPYESTTSWMQGTRFGPAALIEASRYVELYDQELDADPSTVGVHTFPALWLTRDGPAAAARELEDACLQIARTVGNRFLIMLGGEHSVSAPAIRAQAAHRGRRISVLQLDAHADLRDEHEGSAESHACAMRRVLDHADVVGVGIRGISEEEVEVARASDAVHLIYADAMWDNDRWMDEALERLGDPVYITFDVDYFDPSIMPATGTPEPGGGDWYRTLRFLRRVFEERDVVACDVVELAPAPGQHAAAFLAAKLTYKLIGYRFEESL